MDSINEVLRAIIGEKLGIEKSEVDPDRSFFSLGITSIISEEILSILRQEYKNLSSTLLFEYPSINKLGDFLEHLNNSDIQESGDQVTEVIGESGIEDEAAKAPEESRADDKAEEARGYDIAIIGISGRFPKANDQYEYWSNLVANRDCVEEIPKDRWDCLSFYSEDKNMTNTTYCKWGGFIDDVDKFDPLFFHISPKEAELIDPQEKLFMMSCWEAMEDAGYAGSNSRKTNNIGVYVGVTWNEFSLLCNEELLKGRYVGPGSLYWGIPNRVSYFMDFTGPSIAIDTACSSSLVALHEACQAIMSGDCEMALAGGVNLNLHPSKYIFLGQSGFLSSEGKCRSFGEGGDGYVPGEGVGAIVLKPLSRALEDGDYIYGVIRGSAVNHGGKATGYTVPNPTAQKEVILNALARAKVNPEEISYIECHGTGTALGDPIEIKGLVGAFESYTQKKQFCAIGSVKSNIGHLEAAAGIAGLIKILLAMRNGVIPANLHTSILNKKINFSDTPFYVVKENVEWIPGNTRKLIAGISSFGAGGSNAHIILEKYDTPEAMETMPGFFIPIIILSAKSEETLTKMALNLRNFIDKNKSREELFPGIAYSLQTGREQFKHRLAIVCDSMNDLREQLEAYLNGHPRNEKTFSGTVQRNSAQLLGFGNTELDQNFIYGLCKTKNFEKLGMLWVLGADLHWKSYYRDGSPRRISLPAYPFEKEHYWLPNVESGSAHGRDMIASIHPLLHQNTSDLTEQRFTSTFTGREFFLTDHIVQGQQVLPGVACLEMARAAVEQAAGTRVEETTRIRLKNIVWTRPIIIGDHPAQVHIGLFPEEGGEIAYEIYSQTNNKTNSESGGATDEADTKPTVYSQGMAVLSTVRTAPTLNLTALQAECNRTTLSSAQCYEAFKSIGIDYGPARRGIEQLHTGENQVLAKITLAPSISGAQDQFTLHPSLLDAALQASTGLVTGSGDGTAGGRFHKPPMPFALKELEILGPCTPSMWAFVRYSEGSAATDTVQKLDIDICDETGTVCVRMNGLEMQEAILLNAPSAKTSEPFELMTFEEVWQEQDLPDTSPVKIKTMVCFVSNPESQKAIIEVMQTLDKDTKVVFISQDTAYQKQSRQKYNISCNDRNTYEEAFRSIREDCGEVDAVLYLWALEDTRWIQDYSGIIYILQSFAATKLKPRRFLLASQFKDALDRCYLESWIGFERSLRQVLPNTQAAAIYQEAGGQAQETDMKNWLPKLWAELQTPKAQSILYQEGKRHVCRIRPTNITNILSGASRLRTGGTYLITGGCGSLGLLLAEHLAKKVPVNLILTGRSPSAAEKQSKIKVIEDMGSQVLYVQADVCDPMSMQEGLSLAKARFGEIHGVIHAAGIQGVQSILEKDLPEFQKVLGPKIKGTLVLDELLHDEPLDFICYFSSSSAIIGDFGSCDYAIANRFLMAYAHYRNHQQLQGQRQGQVFVVNWPLWRDGGMHLSDPENTKMYLKSSGQRALEAREGTDIFDRILAQNKTQHLVLVGQPSRLQHFLGLVPGQPAALSPIPGSLSGKGRRPEMKGLSLVQCLEWDLKELAGNLLKIPRQRLDKEENLADFGFDSISLTRFATLLTNHYGIEITPALFFSYSTIGKLTQYFLTEHQQDIREFYRKDVVSQATAQKAPAAVAPILQASARPRFIARSIPQDVPEPIAIIGMSGRFPGARNIDEMWAILSEGRDMVTEIPAERFDWRQYYSDSQEPGKTNCKWCGCIPGASEFDPRFFELSPREAETMDPRQRLLLQESFRALEDAAYGARQIKANKIGMFVGVEQGDYQLLAGEKGSITSNSNAILASRLAYFLNLSGPVMAIDTTCSSGLVAAHQACLSLRNRECDTAIAAGVNLLFTPETYIGMSQAGMLSSEGKCFVFDKRASGMVPGEAVAVVVLKRLSQAEADGDPIYAVIQGSAVNYDGKTNGITAPSGVAQTGLLKKVYDQYKINPEEIEYIVTHGTGTRLGDPVEINALYDAFKCYTDKQGYCALTSTKTNFGHTFAASGLVSLISLVESLLHETIPASLHCEQENDYINWQESPFYINKANRSWPKRDGKNRTGAVSAFGMSGTNVHMVIRSYPAKETASSPQPPYYLLALSAKTQEALQQKIQDLITALQNKKQVLSKVSYTLLEGRQHFSYRCAIVIQDHDDAIYVLKQADGRERLPNLFLGKVSRGFNPQKAIGQYAEDLLKQSRSLYGDSSRYQEILFSLADLYCQGYELDWYHLYPETEPQRISLPTYPFARERYWALDTVTTATTATTATTHTATTQPLPKLSLQPVTVTETAISEKTNKPNEISLRSLSDEQILSGKPADQTRQSVALYSTSPPVSQAIINGEPKPAPHLQEVISEDSLQEELITSLAEALYMQRSEIDIDEQFIYMGLDSILGVEWIKMINNRYGTTIPAVRVYDYPSIREFTGFLAKELKGKRKEEPVQKPSEESLQEELITSLAEALYMQRSEIDIDEQFIYMGLDSILGVEWIKMINNRYGTTIPAVRVYDYPSIREFTGFLAKELKGKKMEEPVQIPSHSTLSLTAHEMSQPIRIEAVQEQSPIPHSSGRFQSEKKRFAIKSLRQRLPKQNHNYETSASSIETAASVLDKREGQPEEAIAIIGISGQFPGSGNLAAFWDNLAKGVDCVSEIPATRWSIDEHYDPDPKVPGKTSCKWMGALEDVDRFDPMFFKISPKEAIMMDPQQRLFLENCWRCIEDAGLSPSSLSGSRCGVFAGCTSSDYGQHTGSQGLNALVLMGRAPSILTARISYMLNLKGPCLAIDTACSSSLVAIAEACNSLLIRTSDLALAGGVCVFAGPSMHIMTGKAGMLSADGRCFTFDTRANGFVPGEGVGVLLLKRLSDAVRDQDPIYGVIRGWGVNQDGKTNGITAPSVNSQILLEKEVYQRFNINPATISLVEAHGTGTKLGDPIEVDALVQSFQSFTDKKNYCAVGSVKSNIGHLLAASGAAGVIKVLLALRHKMLPPTINFETLNEHISLDNTPFYINTELKTWDTAPGIPRRAAVSSFGFSGTNAHLVIEEYIPKESTPVTITPGNPAIIVLSAKSEEQLKIYAESLKNHIESHADLNLADIAYTLQVGREAMDERLAMIAVSLKELEEKLQAYLEGRDDIPDLYRGQVKPNNETLSVFTADEDLQKAIEAWIDRGKYSKFLDLWVKGISFDWNKLYGENKPCRIALPTYPFARERYWLPETDTGSNPVSTVAAPTATPTAAAIHPLPHRNTSDIDLSDDQGKTCVQMKDQAHQADSQAAISKGSLQPVTTAEHTFSTKSDQSTKPSGISLQLLNDQPEPGPAAFSAESLQEELITSLAETLYMKRSAVDPDKQFIDMGMDSIIAVEWINVLNKKYGIAILATKVYDYPTIREFSGYLSRELKSTPLLSRGLPAVAASVDSSANEMLPSLSGKIESKPQGTIALSSASAPMSQPIIDKQPESGPAAFSAKSLQEELITNLAETLYMKRSAVDPDKQFIDMGMDSIIAVEWINVLNKKYGISILATKVYDYPTIREFAGYLSKELKSTPLLSGGLLAVAANMDSAANEMLPIGLLEQRTGESDPQASVSQSSLQPKETGDSSTHSTCENETIIKPVHHAPDYREAVAIVGISGRYPEASDMTRYWDNLIHGRNSIREIPVSRWDVNQYYDPAPSQQKIYCKWIGALEDIEYFDPLFFNITPAEAENTDPQHRLFLQEGYKAFEDAGYAGQLLSNKKCGVYLGIMGNEYSLMLQQSRAILANPTGNSSAIAAARIPYFLNLKGPAISIDTACSSSLVATHLACQALSNHEIDMALVGGVTLYLTPELYVSMCAAGMLSPDGQCKTFDDSANGLVPGEGVGALVLKRLKDAELDHDHIYGVIIGSGINQDGKTNGITAPSVNSQIELEREIYDKYKIDPKSVSYVEMHGTGTKLGDPIELEALSTVYKERTGQKNYCAIGSVKSNIGHTSAASGVASIQKVLLCLKHKKLVPTLNFKEHNRYFNFADSPFYVNTEFRPWETTPGIPRRAAVSSFGFSGTNAHVVIEEYIPKESTPITIAPGNPAIIVLSAKSEEQLKTYAESLKNHIESHADLNLADIAYTLQVGREAMEERLAMIAVSRKELEEKLQAYLEGRDDIPALFRGQVKRNKEPLAVFAADEDIQKAIEVWIAKGKYHKLLDLWVKGISFDWNKLYGENKPCRIALPTYPFVRERYWLPETGTGSNTVSAAASPIAAAIHPLLHRNTSDLSEQRFTSTFTGEEFFLADHTVQGQHLLPGVACLEMARAAVQQATGTHQKEMPKISLRNIVWARPIIVGEESVQVHIGLYPEEEGRIAYEIYSETNNKTDSGSDGATDETDTMVHSQGVAMLSTAQEAPTLDMPALQAGCDQATLSSDQVYEAFKTMGIEYDPGHRGIEQLHIGQSQALARLTLPPSVTATKDRFVLHPSLMEAALQASMGLAINNGQTLQTGSSAHSRLFLPSALEELEVSGRCTPGMWALIRYSDGSAPGDGIQKFDIDLCDDPGNICIRMKGLELRSIKEDDLNLQKMDNIKAQTREHPEPLNKIDTGTLISTYVEYLKTLMAEVTKIPRSGLDAEAQLEEYGLDSIIIAKLNQKIEQLIGHLDATLFFKYNSIQSLAAYLAETYPDAVSELINKTTLPAPTKKRQSLLFTKEFPALTSIRTAKPFPKLMVSSPLNIQKATDIAIIGVAGRYPQAKNPDLFWQNLYEGKDCIEEIPASRWSLDGFYEPDRDQAVSKGLSYSKWGGFLDNIDCFDTLFFNISPKDAMFMDPQERLFLEVAWECLEDAGYTRESLKQDGYGNRIGVFVGATFNNYQLFMTEAALRSNTDIYPANSQMFSIANRVSFVMNFTGPSLTVDTACSSSLYAIHLACESIRSGQARMAVAGGVNLSLHPSKYIAISQGQFNASDGRCHAFSEGGTGYVPSEAVGAVFLKPLQDAIKDKDQIYGIIKGTAASHAGKTNGYTVPSPVSQSLAIEEALRRSQIHPRTIGCIEAHGTGTALGDPIEIAGLTDVFRKYTKETGYCSISSVKSNIGHAEAAAGIAQMTKVLLQLKHQTLVKNVMHGKGLNPNIDFTQTPFVVQEKTEYWKRPLIDGQEVPRRAGISSFGAGGSNAHVVIEEYIPKESTPITITSGNPAIIVLSAKSEEQLKTYAESLKNHIESHADLNLADIAYTLQVGREAMEERLAMIAVSLKELEEKLQAYLEGRADIPALYRGQVKRNKETMAVFTADEDLQKAIEVWIAKGKYPKLLDLWVKGISFDWNKLYGENKPCRITLPTYPFARERYWIPETGTGTGSNTVSSAASPIAAAIHPLLHQNTSNLSGPRFTSTFMGEEFFLADHTVQGQHLLPGVACLEMARAAVQQATGTYQKETTKIRLRNIVWAYPIIVGGEPVQVHIGLYPEEDGQIAYEIYSETNNKTDSESDGATDETDTMVHSQGVAMLSMAQEAPTLDMPALQAECDQATLSLDQVYEAFKTMGIEYDSAHRGIEQLYIGQSQALARLTLPPSVTATEDRFVLHPSLMEAALQASMGLAINNGQTLQTGSSAHSRLVLPVALEELEIFGSCTPGMWALIRYSDGSAPGDGIQKFDIDLCDDQGNICVRMKAFRYGVLSGVPGAPESPAAIGALLVEPCWREAAACQAVPAPDYARHLVILCEQNEVSHESIAARMKEARCLILHSPQQEIGERFQIYAAQAFEEVQNILKDKPKDKVLIQIVISTQTERYLCSGLAGLLKTAQMENPKLIVQLIALEPGQDPETIIEQLKENSRMPLDRQVRYQDGKRYVMGLSEIEASKEAATVWKDQGVYLITGGAGGIGLIFAREITQKTKNATLVLTGRRALSEKKQAELKELEISGARIIYRQVDVTGKQAVDDLILSIRQEFSNLSGIIHAAGVIRDNYIIRKTKEELLAVLAPKVTGLVNLDQATKDLDLDLFILFSSIAGVTGNPGQADYAAANAFMDAYAGYRRELVDSDRRHGRTLSINWPPWKEGGMRIDIETEKMIRLSTGLIPMQTSTGIRALCQALASGQTQVLVAEGDLAQVRQKLLLPIDSTASQPEPADAAPQSEKTTAAKAYIPQIEAGLLREKTLHQLKVLFGETTGLSVGRIDPDEPLESYGINSIMISQLNLKLAGIFAELSKTLFFEYQTLGALVDYFIADYPQDCLQWTGLQDQVKPKASPTPLNIEGEFPVLTSLKTVKKQPRGSTVITPSDRTGEPIAIIGISGRYPQAKTLRDYWENLKTGRDCIAEVPAERWPLEGFYHPDQQEAIAQGKSYSKWGGFIEGFTDFDPLFFNISPREALNMDPQERLFIQSCWEVIEDAGYTREQLNAKYHRRIGVFAGITKTGFDLYGPDLWKQGEQVFPYTSFSSVANRISYILNLQGPSMPIDTMCSSSLTAIHEACEHIHRGECEMAIAGGVNLYLHPSNYIGLCAKQMLSPDRYCRGFGQGASGFVPGEGVGCVLLKPLSQAIKDQDHIYALIRGTSINHGGKTNGYTVPNPSAQGELIRRALDKAGVNARTVSYIEAHGTGTELGDPIEVTGLTQAFRRDTKDTGYCAIGSVKSNIGHLEAAAGIAGLAKIVLQMKYRQIAPSLNAEELNPNINFASTPFTVQRELAEWKRPLLELNGQTKEYPRIAGLSSFGAGGSNAHVVIEEYIPPEKTPIAVTREHPAIIILSAKNEDRLQEQAHQLLNAIREQQFSDPDLADIAYTLQVGREAMDERLAMIAVSLQQLEEKLKTYLEGRDGIEDLYRGQVKGNKKSLAVFEADEELKEAIGKWIQRGKYAKLIDLWVNGLSFDWNKLYGETKPRRISLPTYPFAKNRYWVLETGTTTTPIPTETTDKDSLTDHAISQHCLQPVTVAEIASSTMYDKSCGEKKKGLSPVNLTAEKCSATSTQSALADPLDGKGLSIPVQQKLLTYQLSWNLLPELSDTHGVVHVGYYQELLNQAVQQVYQTNMYKVADTEHILALYIPDHMEKNIHLILDNCEDGTIRFQFFSVDERSKSRTLHAQGHITLLEPQSKPTLQLTGFEEIIMRCKNQYSGLMFYQLLNERGMRLGPSVQWIEQVWYREGEALARFRLPLKRENKTSYGLGVTPGVWDACAQVFFAALPETVPPDMKFMVSQWKNFEYTLDERGDELWCHVKLTGHMGVDGNIQGLFYLYDSSGRLVASVSECWMKRIGRKREETLRGRMEIQTIAQEEKNAEMLQQLKTSTSDVQKQTLQDYLRQIIACALNMPASELPTSAPLMDVGMDSLVGLEIKTKIDKALNISLPIQGVQGASIDDLTEDILHDLGLSTKKNRSTELQTKQLEVNDIWFGHRQRSSESKFYLYCLPYGGGGAAIYRHWSESLPDFVEVCPIQMPGKETRIDEEPISNIEAAVKALETILLSDIKGPYGFYGHSMGALIAYRLAAKLNLTAPIKPSHLFVSAYSSPQFDPNPHLQNLLKRFQAEGFSSIPEPKDVCKLTPDEIRIISRILRPDEPTLTSVDLMRPLLPGMLADLKIVESYRHKQESDFDVPITAFHGKKDALVSKVEMKAWKEITSASFKLFTLDGDHLFLLDKKNQTRMLDLISEELTACMNMP